jgi:hypothetical protein
VKASKLRIGVLWLGAATVCPGAQNRLTIVVSDTVGLPQNVIEAFAANQRRRPSLILACVLIHEIAHTLGLKHQTDGVMRAALNPHGIEDVALGLGFTPAEARQLRMGAMRLNDSPPSGEASLSPISATRLAPH